MAKQQGKSGPTKCPKTPPCNGPTQKGVRPTRYVLDANDEYCVRELSAHGVPLHVIAKVINRPWGVDVETMKRHYGVAVQAGKASVIAVAYARLLKAINDPNDPTGVTAAFFLIKRLGAKLTGGHLQDHP